jgi:nucleotide-binding universal stress UspA family protein
VAAEVAGEAHVPVLVARRSSIQRFLVATDGSTTASAIPERLAALGILGGATADVVTVTVPDPPLFELITGLYTLGDERLGRMRAEVEDHARAALEQMTFRLSAAGFEPTPHLRRGDAAHEIVAVAEERAADLVVVGSRGLGVIDRLLLGSVARNVLLHAHCSVLVLRG